MYCGGLGDPLSPPDIDTTRSAPATASKPPLNQRVAEIESQAKPYAAGREILSVVEVIATVVQGSSGRARDVPGARQSVQVGGEGAGSWVAVVPGGSHGCPWAWWRS